MLYPLSSFSALHFLHERVKGMFCFFKNTTSKIGGTIGILILLAAAFVSSIVCGRTFFPLDLAFASVFHYDPTVTDHLIIHTERLPRAVIGTVVGASLAVAGALMQALTRNPLASPSVFGINAGAVFFLSY